MHAIRVARAYTGRELILKFEGNYHGFHDHTLWSTYAPAEAYGNRRSPIPIPASSGIPRALGQAILTLPFNDFEGFERVMRSYGEQIAAVITEPCQGELRRHPAPAGLPGTDCWKTSEYGAVFILDEVKTGFRIAKGGAQEYYNLKPDLATYAKALGNGYPIAAFGGKKEIMSIIGHGVSQGGTTPTTSRASPGRVNAQNHAARTGVRDYQRARHASDERPARHLRRKWHSGGGQRLPGHVLLCDWNRSMTCQRDWAESDRAPSTCAGRQRRWNAA